MLEVKNLCVSYRSKQGKVLKAVRDVSFGLVKGQKLGIVGESGSGKSSVAFAIMGGAYKNAIYSGKILLDGIDMLNNANYKLLSRIRWKKISMIFQGTGSVFNPVVRIKDSIDELIRFKVEDDTDIKQLYSRLYEMMERFMLDKSLLFKYPHQLSGGEKQRFAIISALIFSPDYVIADEPTSGLDILVQQEILSSFLLEVEKNNLALVFITHDIKLVSVVCDRLIVMLNGMVVEMGDVSDLLNEPLHPYTRFLVESTNTIVSGVLEPKSSFENDKFLRTEDFKGCVFFKRCPFRVDDCYEAFPPLYRVYKDRYVRCYSFI